jgi:hypothetical protein
MPNTEGDRSMKTRTAAWWIATVTLLTLTVGCGGTQQVADTPENRQEISQKLAELSVQSGSLNEILDNGAEMAAAANAETLKVALGRELSVEEQRRVLMIMRGVLEEFLTPEVWAEIMAETFAGHFTATELQSILTFYESEAGNKVLRLDAQMKREIDAKTEARFGGRFEEFANRVDQELARAFGPAPPGGGQ